MKFLLSITVLCLILASCTSTTVLVKKDSCKDVFGGVLMECESVKK